MSADILHNNTHAEIISALSLANAAIYMFYEEQSKKCEE